MKKTQSLSFLFGKFLISYAPSRIGRDHKDRDQACLLQVNDHLKAQQPSSFCLQVPVFLVPAKLGFCSSAHPLPHAPGAPEVPGPGDYEALCSEVPEVFLVSI